MSETYQDIQLNFSDAGLKGNCKVRDLWRQKETGFFKDSYPSKIPPHGVALLRIVNEEKAIK